MKINKIKSIVLCGYIFNIDWDPETYGGQFDFSEQKIVIGTKLEDHTVFQILMHEISEVLHVCMNNRYYNSDGPTVASYLFCMSHKDFEVHNSLLCDAISKFIS